MTIAWHTMHATRDRRVIFKTPTVRADAAWRVRRIGRKYGLLVFHLGTDHIHTVVTCSAQELPGFAQALEVSLTRGCGLDPGFGRYHAKPINDQGHLETTYSYVLRQELHHGTALDPGHIGSNGPDLVGWRLAGQSERELHRRFAPRLRESDLRRILLAGRPRVPLEVLGGAPHGLHGVALETVVKRGAAQALGLVRFGGQSGAMMRVRRALLEILEPLSLAETIDLSRLFGGARRIARLRQRRLIPTVAASVRDMLMFQLALIGPPRQP